MSKNTFPHYQSPLTLLSKLGINGNGGTLDKNDFILARKALLAEFELSQKTTIKWEGREVSRDDILKLFDAFQSGDLIEYHNAVQQDEVLNRFVAQHKLDLEDSFSDNPLYETDGFKRFIGLYFGAAFAHNVLQLLQKPDFVAARALFALPQLWDYESAQENWEIIQKALEKKLDGLKKAKENPFSHGIQIDGRGETAYFHPDLISLLNFLPESFEQFRTDYGTALIELAIKLINQGKAETGIYVFNRAKVLKGGFKLQLMKSHLEGQLDKLDHLPDRSSIPTGRIIWIVVSILIFMLRIMMNCSR